MNGDEEKADNNNDALEFHHGYLVNDYLSYNLLIKNNQEVGVAMKEILHYN